MPVAHGSCPNCGAPIEFAIGASAAKVCDYCRHTVVRRDRGLENLGKAADLAPTSSLIAVGDEGTLSGRPFKVLGRVQLDYGSGPWEEYFLALDHGAAWGWLAYAQGRWHATVPVDGIATPAFDELSLEADVVLGRAGSLRVVEIRSARVLSAEGELPHADPPGTLRYYADLVGPNSAFATLDYGSQGAGSIVYLGWIFAESALNVTQLGPRSAQKVATTTLRCPGCGGDVPALLGDRSERLGCPYCGAVSSIAERIVVQRQQAERERPVLPIGARGTLAGTEVTVIAYIRRGSRFEGELYQWDEFLLWGRVNGFNWLVRDPETGWSHVTAANVAELDLSERTAAVSYRGSRYRLRNSNTAKVTHVLGEVYWRCEVGEQTDVMDYVHGDEVLSREASEGEVNWSHSRAIAWPVVANAFGLPLTHPGGRVSTGSPAGASQIQTYVVVGFFLVFLVVMVFAQLASDEGATSGTGTYRGGGIYSGGK